MKARITLTIHEIGVLSPEQLGELAGRLMTLFGSMVALARNEMLCSFVTDDHSQAFQTIEKFNVELARAFSPDLWTSIASEEMQA